MEVKMEVNITVKTVPVKTKREELFWEEVFRVFDRG